MKRVEREETAVYYHIPPSTTVYRPYLILCKLQHAADEGQHLPRPPALEVTDDEVGDELSVHYILL